MTSGYKVVVVSTLLIECAKLYQSIAHHIRVGSQTCLYFVHGVLGHLIPIFLVTVYHLQLASVFVRYGCSHLQVFLTGAVPLLLLFRTYLNVETIRMKSHTSKLIYDNTAVYTA